MKRASRKQWEARIKAWRASGETAAAFARKRGYPLRSLRWWRWQLNATARDEAAAKPAPSPSAPLAINFVEMSPQDIPFDHDGDMLEVVLPSKLFVRVRPGFDSAALSALLDLLERRR